MERAKFSLWLEKQIDRQDPIGDLARDASGDKDTYKLTGLEDWIRHLERHRADDGAFDACGRAWVKFYRTTWGDD